jgi:hypothetical protein
MTFEEATRSPKKDGSAGGSGGSMISSTPQNAPTSTPSRKDPNEEFFMMTFLSYKLTHSEFEKVLAVNSLLFTHF